MNNNSILHATLDDLVRGYSCTDSGDCVCLHCQQVFEAGQIYEISSRMYLPERAAALHVEAAHDGAFSALSALGTDAAGLPEVQFKVLYMLHEGKNDVEIAAALGGKSSSTVRNHRFQLRRRESEARIFLALMKLLDERGAGAGKFIEYPAGMPANDERAAVTPDEAAKIESRYLRSKGESGLAIASWPKHQKEKLVLLRRVAGLFEDGRLYAEKEVNAILMPVWDDHVTIRRYLIEYRFLDRKPDGSAYWLT